jgi:hypothetical protein
LQHDAASAMRHHGVAATNRAARPKEPPHGGPGTGTMRSYGRLRRQGAVAGIHVRR